jgi:aarF domain-containing kinase
MLSLGLRARHTPPFSFTRRLSRWPQRRSRTPLPFRSDVTGGVHPFAAYSIAVVFGAGVGYIAYENRQPFRHTLLAVARCSRVASE